MAWPAWFASAAWAASPPCEKPPRIALERPLTRRPTTEKRRLISSPTIVKVVVAWRRWRWGWFGGGGAAGRGGFIFVAVGEEEEVKT